MSFISVFLYTSSIAIIFLQCKSSGTSQKEVTQAMAEYDRRIMTVNADSIAALFAEDGKLGTVASGRSAIRSFLAGFANVKVLSQRSSIEQIEKREGQVLLMGHYQQSDLINMSDTVHVSGSFIAHWIKEDGKWRISLIETTPDKPANAH